MRTCELGFEHEDPEPEVVVEEAPDTEPVAEAAVEVARIEADRDVAVAKITSRTVDEETAATIAAMAARIEVLEAAAAPAEEQQQEAVVVVADPEPEPEPQPDQPPPPEAEESHHESPVKRKNAWWG